MGGGNRLQLTTYAEMSDILGSQDYRIVAENGTKVYRIRGSQEHGIIVAIR